MTTEDRLADIEKFGYSPDDEGFPNPDVEWLCAELRKALARVAAARAEAFRASRDLVHEILKEECAFHEVLGWSHGWRCDSIRDAILATIVARQADKLEAAARKP